MFSNRGAPYGFNLKTNPLRNSLYANYYSDAFIEPVPPSDIFIITENGIFIDTEDDKEVIAE